MLERASHEIANGWVQAHRDTRAQQAGELSYSLSAGIATLPDGVDWAVELNEKALHTLLALKDLNLWRVTVSHRDQTGRTDEVLIEHVLLTPATCRLAVALRPEQDTRGGVMQRVSWLRTYHLQVLQDGGAPFEVQVEGRDTIRGGFVGEQGPDQGERFGRALAAAFGWSTE